MTEDDRDFPAEGPAERTYSPKAIVFAAVLGGLAIGIIAGGAVFLIGFRSNDSAQPDKQASLPSTQRAEAPTSKQSEKAAIPEKPIEAPQTYEAAELRKIYSAYEGNEAAADAMYLNERFQFTFEPWAIDKDSSGAYYAWSNIFGLSDENTRGRHFNCYFRADQAQALAEFKRGQVLTIRGVCAGKTGMIRTYYPPVFNDGTQGFFKSNPAIAFKDCELVGKPADKQVSKPPDEPAKKPPEKPAEEEKPRSELVGFSHAGSHGAGGRRDSKVGDTGKFFRLASNPKLQAPFDAGDVGYSYWVIRVDGPEEMVVRGRLVDRNVGNSGAVLGVDWGRPFVLKGVPTKGMKPNQSVEPKGVFKITEVRRSKQGTGFLVFERQEEKEGKGP
jgi:hypothetical protein